MMDDIYNGLLLRAKSSKAKKSLSAINETCKKLHDSGSIDFSVMVVARAGASTGVPKAQSIRNKSGVLYRELINAWQAKCNTNKDVATGSSTQWIDRIEDAATKFLVRDLLAKKRALNAELQLLKSVKILNIDMRSGADSLNQSNVNISLVDSEKQALKTAIDSKTLDRLGWVKLERGAVGNLKEEIIFERGFITAIEKILKLDN